MPHMLIGYASNADRPAEVVSTPGVATLPELPLTSWHEDAYWAPYATYMEDVGEKGLRLTAALNKCERFRNVGLKKGAGFTLNALMLDTDEATLSDLSKLQRDGGDYRVATFV
eukprot:g15010.t1